MLKIDVYVWDPERRAEDYLQTIDMEGKPHIGDSIIIDDLVLVVYDADSHSVGTEIEGDWADYGITE